MSQFQLKEPKMSFDITDGKVVLILQEKSDATTFASVAMPPETASAVAMQLFMLAEGAKQ